MKTKLTKEEHVAIGHKLQTLCAELQIICVRVQSAESPLSSVAGNARKVGTILDSARPLDLLRCQLEDVFYRDFPSDGPSPYYNTAEKVVALGASVIAALYVATGGCYFGLPDVDPWDEARDARKYDGPHAVVAHPPCQRWGQYATGGPNPKARRREVGDDNGCFAAALASVRTCGGVLEHPAASKAWAAHGLAAPPRAGGWIMADEHGGWTCNVEQGHYGHRARKATWLYAVGCELPSLKWGPSKSGVRLDAGFHSKEERERYKSGRLRARVGDCERMGKQERTATPCSFRDLLLSIARSARR